MIEVVTPSTSFRFKEVPPETDFVINTFTVHVSIQAFCPADLSQRSSIRHQIGLSSACDSRIRTAILSRDDIDEASGCIPDM
jgi:hypothetical protein